MKRQGWIGLALSGLALCTMTITSAQAQRFDRDNRSRDTRYDDRRDGRDRRDWRDDRRDNRRDDWRDDLREVREGERRLADLQRQRRFHLERRNWREVREIDQRIARVRAELARDRRDLREDHRRRW
jgi:hypothetical protein